MLGKKGALSNRLLDQAHEEEGAKGLLIGYDWQEGVIFGCPIEAEVLLKEIIAVLLYQALPLLLVNHLEVILKRQVWLFESL